MSTSPTTSQPSDALRPDSGRFNRSGGAAGADPRHVARLFEQLPPHAIEAEMCLLGSILLEPRVLGDTTFTIRDGGDFYKPTNGAIYDAMIELYDTNASLDIVQLSQLLIDRDILDAVGGQEYLVELASGVPTAANANHYARLVREKAMVRRLIEEAGAILQDAFESRESASSILDAAEHRIFSIADRYEHSEIEVLGRLVQEVVERLQASDGTRSTGVATGFTDLDEVTGAAPNHAHSCRPARPTRSKRRGR